MDPVFMLLIQLIFNQDLVVFDNRISLGIRGQPDLIGFKTHAFPGRYRLIHAVFSLR
jgi:hypothetical protein